ncbi:MAG TPA: hypothetical protein VGE07_27950 [Herpetosiphonaceae bacterium]
MQPSEPTDYRVPAAAEEPLPAQGFFLRWFAATLSAMILNGLLGYPLVAAFNAGGGLNDANYWLYAVIFLLINGAWAGLAQWLALRRALPGARRWILATIAGYVGGSALFGFQGTSWLAILVATVIAGSLQWLVLRSRVRGAGWWIAACIINTLVGMRFSPWLFESAYYQQIAADPTRYQLSLAIWMLLTATLALQSTIVTGPAMLWLLRRRRTKREQADYNSFY